MVLPSNVQFQGRWDLDSDDRYMTHWCGSSLCFQTTSRSVTLQLGSLTVSRQNYHNVLWRFGSQSVTRTSLVKGRRAMILTPSGAGAGSTHGGEVLLDVTVMLCDWGATLQILDITATDGRAILPPATGYFVRPMLFIGASLVSGYSPPFSGLVLPHGTYQAFGSVVIRILRARGVDARLEMVASPGLCLITMGLEKGMEDVFWDGMDGVGGWEQQSNDPPDDIFVCLGNKDKGLGVDKDEFLQHYQAFLVRLRDSYPDSLKRIHVISPFGIFDHPSEPKHRIAIFEPELQHMVEALAESWRESHPEGVKLYHIGTDGWIDKSLTCDGLHPTTEGHEEIGAKLVECLDAQSLV